MLNSYTDYGEYVAVHADGDTKYGLNILINKSRLALVQSATNTYWRIVYKNFNYFAYTVDNKKLIYMHELLTGINDELVEERYLNGGDSSKMVSKPFRGQTSLVKHKNGNGLVNVDNNLIITSSKVSSDEDYADYLEPILLFIDEDDIYNCSLKTILNSEDELTKEDNILIFKEHILSLANDPVFKRFGPDITVYKKIFDLYEQNKLTGDLLKTCDATISELYEALNNIYTMSQSSYCFPGHVVIVHPNIRVKKSLKEHICSFSGAKIRKGSEYLSYQLFIEDLTDNCIYTLAKAIPAEIGYEDYFPQNIHQLDDFIYKVKHSYELGLEDYYNFATNTKCDDLGITLIKKR